MPADHALAVSLLQDLVRIPSVNPALVPGAPGEADVAAYIAAALREWGLEVDVREVAPGRPNAVATLRGTGGGRTLLFNGHMDTVGVEGMAEPYSGELRDGRVHGRGAIDMKGSLAATLAATKALVDDAVGLRGDVVFTYVADEEYASLGTEGVVADIDAGRLPRPDAAVNTEPTGLRVGLGHKGFTWVEVATEGTAAHGSRPDLGVDAIAQMGKVLVEVGRWQAELAAGDRHPLLGAGSVHASLIDGGREMSSYPDRCTLKLERRTVPPETVDTVAAEVGGILDRLAAADPMFRASSAVTFVRNPWQADPGSTIVSTTSAAIERVTRAPAETMTQTGWLDSALLGNAGIPTVICGPRGDGLHAVDESVEVASLGTCAEIYEQIIRQFCG
jgi:acetylornithine deacetylase